MDRPAESGPYLLASLAELMHGKNLVYSGYLKPVIMRQGNDVLLPREFAVESQHHCIIILCHIDKLYQTVPVSLRYLQ